eukprot:1887466-Prymnesium_polylepis.3
MCWSLPVSASMVLLGFATAIVSPPGWIRAEVLYVNLMEMLQLAGLLASPANAATLSTGP